MEVNLDSMLHIVDKVIDFLDTHLKDPFELYMATILISILYEEKCESFSLDPEFETKVRQLAKEKAEELASD
jgi:hypothetical protein